MVTGAVTGRLWDRYGPVLRDLYAANGPCHDLGHAIRVARLAERIAAEEGADPALPVLAALFHDCGHGAARRDGTDDHEVRSATATGAALRDELTPEELREVVDAIRGRRFRNRAAARTGTGAILDDADNLDALGATGLARALLWIGEHGATGDGGDAERAFAAGVACGPRRHWDEKLSLLAGGMRTPTGRRLAVARHRRLAAALNQLDAEVDELYETRP